jgi:hypothetical protein
MSVYRRLARSKKGMSTVFGGLFFVIIILMGFNVMLWGFIQYDAYNHVITSMSQRDQQAVSENLVPVNATYPTGGPLNIIVNNLGGSAVSIAAIYIWNTNTTGTTQCRPTPCILYAPPPSFTYFTNGNIPAGSVNFVVHAIGINVKDGNSYRITLATTRGREFSLYYPWRFNSLIINGGSGGNFVTNVGPLAIYFDFKSFNYTNANSGACSGTPGNPSCPAFCMPSNAVVLYLRVANTASDSAVTILTQTGLEAQAYGVNGFGQFAQAWLLSPNSINPGTNFPYALASNNYTLAPAGVNGPTPQSFAILKIGAGNAGGSGAVTFGNTGRTWITFIGIYYLYKGQPQGETIPFMDFFTNQPNCVT